jgi:putative ABC transport system ATP-binding protein
MMVDHDNHILGLAAWIVNMADATVKSDIVSHDAVRVCAFLRSVELFKNFTAAEIANVAEKMKRRFYAQNDVIVREGDPGEEFFLIGKGQVAVRKDAGNGGQKHIATLTAGMFFGERSLIADEPRNATCAAGSAQVEVFALGKADFKRALESSASFRDQIQSVSLQRQ